MDTTAFGDLRHASFSSRPKRPKNSSQPRKWNSRSRRTPNETNTEAPAIDQCALFNFRYPVGAEVVTTMLSVSKPAHGTKLAQPPKSCLGTRQWFG